MRWSLRHVPLLQSFAPPPTLASFADVATRRDLKSGEPRPARVECALLHPGHRPQRGVARAVLHGRGPPRRHARVDESGRQLGSAAGDRHGREKLAGVDPVGLAVDDRRRQHLRGA